MKQFCEDELYGICGQSSYQAVIEYLESCEDGQILMNLRKFFKHFLLTVAIFHSLGSQYHFRLYT